MLKRFFSMRHYFLTLGCIIIALVTSSAKGFFWVPNRYTAPFWSGDTHITQGNINSWDFMLGGSYGCAAEASYNSVDMILSWYQTLSIGFFCDATMPLTKLDVHCAPIPLDSLENGICYENCSLLLGWGINHDMLPILDFVDFMIRTGIVTPAHMPPLPKLRIETVYGYPDWGIPVAGDLALGIFNWLTVGMHTSMCQFFGNPFVWHLQPYLKADHFLIGLSGWFGYSYTGAQQDTGSKCLFVGTADWSMHTLHYGIEYEFIQSYFPIHPRLGAYYNQHVGGNNAAARSNFGLTVGFDITW
jgi:hypothetical protein